jgi:hypothetical protein
MYNIKKKPQIRYAGNAHTYIHTDMSNYDDVHWQVLWRVASFGVSLTDSHQVGSFQANSSVGKHLYRVPRNTE